MEDFQKKVINFINIPNAKRVLRMNKNFMELATDYYLFPSKESLYHMFSVTITYNYKQLSIGSFNEYQVNMPINDRSTFLKLHLANMYFIGESLFVHVNLKKVYLPDMFLYAVLKDKEFALLLLKKFKHYSKYILRASTKLVKPRRLYLLWKINMFLKK